MSLTEWGQRVRQSKDDMEVEHGEQVALPPREPALARLCLTLRAVPVAAGVYMAPGATTRDENRYYPGAPRGRITLAPQEPAHEYGRERYLKHNALSLPERASTRRRFSPLLRSISARVGRTTWMW
jgi:hypothetical protein